MPRCRWQKKGCDEQEEIQSATSAPRTVARQYFWPVTGSRTSKLMLFLYNDIAHRFELLVPCSHPFVTPLHFPCQGNLCLRRQMKRSLIERSFLFLSAPLHSSLTCDIASQQRNAAVICCRQNNPVNCFGVAIQWGNGSCRQHIQSHRFELLVPRSHPFVTPWHFPCQGNLCLRRHDWVTIIKPSWKSLNCQGLSCFLWAVFKVEF